MLYLTLMIGITCGAPAALPDGECREPQTQYAVSNDPAGAAADLALCRTQLGKLYTEIEKRGAVFDSLLYCDQREVGMQR